MSALSASAFTATPVARRALRGAKPTRPRAAAFRVNAAYDSVEARRAAETERVMDRTQEIHNVEEFEAALSLAGEKLVMVAVESEEECVMSDDNWSKNAGSANLQFDGDACRTLSSSLARIAREATDVNFLRVEVLEGGRARDVAKSLGVTKYPTYQYYKVRSRPSRASPSPSHQSLLSFFFLSTTHPTPQPRAKKKKLTHAPLFFSVTPERRAPLAARRRGRGRTGGSFRGRPILRRRRRGGLAHIGLRHRDQVQERPAGLHRLVLDGAARGCGV